MHERFVDVATPDGPMDTFITHPEAGGPFPAVVVFMDIWGLREELFDVARRIATVGYYCVVPNFYHRHGKVRFEFRNSDGRMISFDRLEPQTRGRIETIFKGLSDAMVMRDVGALIEFARAEGAARAALASEASGQRGHSKSVRAGHSPEPGSSARTGAMGSIGYCMGGRHVLCAAGHFPQHFVASASLHGTAMISERADSPHRLADRFRGELYCGYGERDRHTPPELVVELARVLQGSAVEFSYLVHRGGEHGYALPDRDVFDKQAANRDWERIFAMFRRRLQA
jgi:carboxymethylenebutenolidase